MSTSKAGDEHMGGTALPAWDTLILALPFIGILGMVMFRLDGHIAAPKTRPAARRFFCEAEGKGKAFLTDPDGTPWLKGAGCRQIEARFSEMDGAGQAPRAPRAGAGIGRTQR